LSVLLGFSFKPRPLQAKSAASHVCCKPSLSQASPAQSRTVRNTRRWSRSRLEPTAAGVDYCYWRSTADRGNAGIVMAKKAKKRKYSKSAGSDVESEMRRYKKGTAKSGKGGKGGKVKSQKQAIAIGLSKARKKGKKVPKKVSKKAKKKKSS
jgi:hypothetical protein